MRRSNVRMTIVLTLTCPAFAAAIAGAVEPLTEGTPPPAPEAVQHHALQDPGRFAGVVTQTMDVREYTYAEIDTGDGLVWVAGPITKLAVGDTVEVPSGIRMVDFRSTAMNRTFDEIHLVHTIRVKSGEGGGKASAARAADAGAGADVSGIERVEGGRTVGEVIADRASLSGQEVAVRGKVTKINTGILGRNWLHLADGSVGPDGEQDLMVTTKDVAEVGSTVVVRGAVATDQDFGYGYRYSVLIENAAVTPE